LLEEVTKVATNSRGGDQQIIPAGKLTLIIANPVSLGKIEPG
jgi:hypothetical protein